MPAAYKRRITQKERKDDGIERFITPSVPFAERRIIKMKSVILFDRKCFYNHSYEIKKDIKIIDEIIGMVGKPQILSYNGLESIKFNVSGDRHFIGSDCVYWLVQQWHKSDNPYIRERLLEISKEDVKWTEERNKGYTGIFYRKIVFNEDAQKALIAQLLYYKKVLGDIYETLLAVEILEEKERQREKGLYEISKEYKFIKPQGGEDGEDGYYDADYKNVKTGEILRFVSRDVFDVGCYDYPKRLEKTGNSFNRELWTEEEIAFGQWISKFGKFHGIRM